MEEEHEREVRKGWRGTGTDRLNERTDGETGSQTDSARVRTRARARTRTRARARARAKADERPAGGREQPYVSGHQEQCSKCIR